MNLPESHHPIISIITPSYNQSAFLTETIESVLTQRGDFFLEYIIVDGGSGDGSIDIIRHYDELLNKGEWPIQCGRISYRWVSGQDEGQTDALIKGFRMATGSIFAWLNSDDTYLPGALQAAVDFFHARPDAGLVYGDADYVDTAGSLISRYHTEEFDLLRLAAANIICQPAAFFRRKAFEAVGGLDGTLDFVMDYDLWIKIGRCFPCIYVPGLRATYRLHETSKTLSSKTLVNNSTESLAVTIRHFGWAPLTRVYTSCSIRCKARLPQLLVGYRIVRTVAAVICTIIRSLRFNRGLHRNDLALLNRENIRKLSRSRLEIMTGR